MCIDTLPCQVVNNTDGAASYWKPLLSAMLPAGEHHVTIEALGGNNTLWIDHLRIYDASKYIPLGIGLIEDDHPGLFYIGKEWVSRGGTGQGNRRHRATIINHNAVEFAFTGKGFGVRRLIKMPEYGW